MIHAPSTPPNTSHPPIIGPPARLPNRTGTMNPHNLYNLAQDDPSLSPSSSICVQPTGTGNDSPSTMNRPPVAHIRHQSSRIEAWLSEQHRIAKGSVDLAAPEDDVTPLGTKCHPYLAYPHLSAISLSRHPQDDRSPAARNASGLLTSARAADDTPRPSPPPTPRKTSPLRSGHRRLNSSSPLRNFHISFGGRRPSISSDISAAPGSVPSTAHARTHASDFSTTYAPSRSERTASPEHASSWLKSPPAWKFRRPGPMPPVAATDAPSSDAPRSRPSLSSSVTRSSATSNAGRTSLDDTPSTSRKLAFGSVRGQSPSIFSATSPSLWSLPTDASHMNDPPDSEKVIARDHEKAAGIRIPLSLKIPSANAPSLGSVSAVLGSPRNRRKRKLIISGIRPGDETRFEAVKRWCESFGDVNSITREPNGNLHVDFRKAEVAETVCRLQARVYIKGVGSVCLSYFTGKRP